MARLEHYPVKKLKKEILEIVGKYLDLKKCRVFFFGSRVEGKGDEHSDIDIGIEGASEVPATMMENIKEEIESLPVLYKIEIVDFKILPAKFKNVIGNRIEAIN